MGKHDHYSLDKTPIICLVFRRSILPADVKTDVRKSLCPQHHQSVHYSSVVSRANREIDIHPRYDSHGIKGLRLIDIVDDGGSSSTSTGAKQDSMVTIRARLYTTIVKEMQARLNPHVKAERICHSDGISLGAHQATMNPDAFQVCAF